MKTRCFYVRITRSSLRNLPKKYFPYVFVLMIDLGFQIGPYVSVLKSTHYLLDYGHFYFMSYVQLKVIPTLEDHKWHSSFRLQPKCWQKYIKIEYRKWIVFSMKSVEKGNCVSNLETNSLPSAVEITKVCELVFKFGRVFVILINSNQ